MFIVYVGGMVFPSGNAAAQRVIANAIGMAEAGYSPILLGLSSGGDSETSEMTRLPSVSGFPTYQMRYPQSPIDWLQHLVSSQHIENLIMELGKVSVYAVICYNMPAIASLRLLRFCRRYRIRFISDCTEWYAAEPGFRGLLKRVDTEMRMRVIIPAGRNVICISRFLATYYEKRGCNVVVIPSLVDCRDPKWQRAYSPNEPRVLVYAGSPGFSGTKDRVDMVIKAVLLCNMKGYSCRLDVIGITREEYESKILGGRQTADGFKERVHFFGRIPHEEVLAFVKRADFTIFAREVTRVSMAGFPTKLAESWACGTPVITTDTSDIRSYLEPGVNGFIVDQCSIESFADVIEKALTLPNSDLVDMHEFCFRNNSLDVSRFRHALADFLASVR